MILNKKVENNKIYITLDVKTIIIILLSLTVIGLLVFINSGDGVERYEQQIKNLNDKNKELLLDNDSIKKINSELSKDIINLNTKIGEINLQLDENKDLINRLKKRKGEILTNVDVMDADGVASGISDYLKRRN